MVDQDLRLDPEELDDPLEELDMDRGAQTKRLAHLFLDLGGHRQGHLGHRITRRQLEQHEDHEGDEQKGRDGKNQSPDRKGQHGRRLCGSL